MQIREQQVWEEAGSSAFPQLPGNPDAPAPEAAGGGRRGWGASPEWVERALSQHLQNLATLIDSR